MFRKAERKKAKLRLGIAGPPGSGKTYSALLIAQGLGGRIAQQGKRLLGAARDAIVVRVRALRADAQEIARAYREAVSLRPRVHAGAQLRAQPAAGAVRAAANRVAPDGVAVAVGRGAHLARLRRETPRGAARDGGCPRLG